MRGMEERQDYYMAFGADSDWEGTATTHIRYTGRFGPEMRARMHGLW